MIRKTTAVLALLALCGVLPVAAQEAMGEAKEAMGEAQEAMGEAKEAMGEAKETMGEAKETMASDKSLEEVLEAHYQAIGGKDAWKSVEAIRYKGKMAMGPGMEAPFTMTMQRPEKIRLEFTIQGMTGVQASDGKTAWMLMPFMGKTDPEEMPADQARQLKEQADIDGELFDWKAKGHTVELVGKEEVEGTEVYKLKVTRADGEQRWHFLDSEHFVPIRQEAKTTMRGQELDIETTIGDYKEVGGLMIPHSIESKPKGAPQGQVITIEEVVVNPGDLSDEMFAMPAKKAAEEKAAE